MIQIAEITQAREIFCNNFGKIRLFGFREIILKADLISKSYTERSQFSSVFETYFAIV